MTEATAPPFTGLHHFALTVRDIKATAAWSPKVCQANPWTAPGRTTGASRPGMHGWSSSPARAWRSACTATRPARAGR